MVDAWQQKIVGSRCYRTPAMTPSGVHRASLRGGFEQSHRRPPGSFSEIVGCHAPRRVSGTTLLCDKCLQISKYRHRGCDVHQYARCSGHEQRVVSYSSYSDSLPSFKNQPFIPHTKNVLSKFLVPDTELSRK